METERIATPPVTTRREPSGAATVTVARPQPTSKLARAFAPDVARGLMLLFIVLANTTFYLYGSADGILVRPIESTPFDRVVNAVAALLIDNRAFPMFAFLFAYGIHQLTTREQLRGAPWPEARRLLLRRNLWLLAIGASHAILLFNGDIVTSYAVLGLLLVVLVRVPNAVLWLVFWLSMTAFLLLTVSDGVFASGFVPLADTATGAVTATTFIEGYGELVLTGLLAVATSPFSALTLLPPMMLGLLLARKGILERPWEHLRLTRTIAYGGIALGILGGIPFAIAFIFGYFPSPAWIGWSVVHGLTGLVAGPAYACAIALVMSRAERRRLETPGSQPGPIARALTALGRRSLSGYIAQSVFCIVLFPAWTLGLGGVVGTGWAAVIGLAIWLVTLAGAVVLDRLDRPGPLEWVHRRLSYGKRGAAPASPAPESSAPVSPAH